MISVVVCTYNRADLLEIVLKSLCAQTLDRCEYEVIVVDNNSTDATRDVTESFCADHPNIRYFFEPRQGLSHARNRGWQEARGKYVGYIDDDAKAPEQWLEVAKQTIEQAAPAVFGGPYFAFFNSSNPPWFRDAYGSNTLGTVAMPLAEGRYLTGSNLFIERALLQKLGGFDPTLGMSGHRLGYGEETALQRRIRSDMTQAMIYYEPRMYVFHLVPARKMQMRWIVKQRFQDGRFSQRVFAGSEAAQGDLAILARMVRTVIVLALELVFLGLFRDRQRYPYYQNYLYEHGFRHLRRLGALYEQWRCKRESRDGERSETGLPAACDDSASAPDIAQPHG